MLRLSGKLKLKPQKPKINQLTINTSHEIGRFLKWLEKGNKCTIKSKSEKIKDSIAE